MDLTYNNATEIIRYLQLQVKVGEARLKDVTENSDIFFLLTNAIIVYFMQCGFAFLECGTVRAKNATNILTKNIIDSFLGAIFYWTVGFAFAWGHGNPFIGHQYFATKDLPSTDTAFWFWNFVFAFTSTTIVSGALAERCDLSAYLIYTACVTGFVYPVASHWVWGPGGWLKEGLSFDIDNVTHVAVFEDFAGSGVVHFLGGMLALIGAILLGSRIGRFDDDGSPNLIRGHSVPLTALGGFILYFGFFSFISGSQIKISSPGSGMLIGRVVVNAMMCLASAGLTSMILHRLICLFRRVKPTWSLLVTINGGIAGMVAICACAQDVHPWSSVVIGVVAGINYMCWSALIVRLKIDDPMEAIAVHGGSGLWGVMSVSIFSIKRGIIFNWGKAAFMGMAWQLVGVLAIGGWALVMGLLTFGLLKYFGILRVDREVELGGLDILKHGEAAYPLRAYHEAVLPHGIQNGRPQTEILKEVIHEEEDGKIPKSQGDEVDMNTAKVITRM